MTTTTLRAPDCITTGLPDHGIYVACLASYNAGTLHGHWIDLTAIDCAGDIQEAIDWILSTSPEPGAEEYAVHDHVGAAGIVCSGDQWPDLEKVAELAENLATAIEEGAEDPWMVCCQWMGYLIDFQDFIDCYLGHAESGTRWAEDYHDSCGTELGQLSNYIDWSAVWRDASLGGDVHAEDCPMGGVYVFSCH